MLTRRTLFVIAAALLAPASAVAQPISQVARDQPERKSILDSVRMAVENRLGIKVVFVVERMTIMGDWAFASLRPRDAAGQRINYRRTRYAQFYNADLDSDTEMALLKREGAIWSLVEEAFLPTDVAWEEWQQKYKLPRTLFAAE